MASVIDLSDYTSTQIIADVSPTMEIVLATNPRTAWVSMGEARRGDETGLFKWTEFVNEERTTTLNANYTAASGTMTVVDSSVYRVGDQVHIEGHVDASFRKIVFEVTAIPDGVTLTVSHNTNSGTDTSLTAASQAIHRASSVPDNWKPSDGGAFEGVDEPTVENNYFQTFQLSLELGQKAMELARNGGAYGIQDAVTEGMRQRMFNMSYHIYNQLMRGFRRAESAGVGSAFGGLADFVIGTGTTGAGTNLVDAGAAALTEDMLNDLFEQMTTRGLEDGAPMILLMSPKNTRLLSSLRNAVVSPTDFIQNTAFGGNVQAFYSELPGFGAAQILLDHNLEDSTVYLVNTDSIEWVTKANAEEPMSAIVDATEPGQKGKRWLIRTELGLRINSATRRNGAIVNIA